MAEKRCSKCGEVKPVSEFGKNRSAKEGLQSWCKVCHNEARKQLRQTEAGQAATRKANRKSDWKRQGIQLTHEEYDLLLQAQGHRCACCGIHQSELKKVLHVDHDHETGKVRGLLCSNCNTGIGKLGDNAKGIRKALAYVEAADAD